MDKVYDIRFNIEEEYMSNKIYNPLALSIIHLDGEWSKDIARKYINKTKFRGLLNEKFGMTRKTVKRFIDCMLKLGFLKEDGNNFILENVEGIFTTLNSDIVRFCSDHFSDLDFKVYLYLVNKWNIHKKYNYDENYFFSHSEIAQIIGYSKNNVNSIRVVKECLMHLENEDLIKYNHTPIHRKGHNGVYMELYNVKTTAKTQKEALNETLEQAPLFFNESELDLIDNIQEYSQLYEVAKKVLGNDYQKMSTKLLVSDIELSKQNIKKYLEGKNN